MKRGGRVRRVSETKPKRKKTEDQRNLKILSTRKKGGKKNEEKERKEKKDSPGIVKLACLYSTIGSLSTLGKSAPRYLLV